MNETLPPEVFALRSELEKQLRTLKNNRDKVPLEILKTKYKSGYDELCKNISLTATKYTKQVILYGICIHRDYLDEAILIINSAIEESGLLRALSLAAFCKQDITEFTDLTLDLRKAIMEKLEIFYQNNTGLYITRNQSGISSDLYCFANNSVLRDGKWVPFDIFYSSYHSLQSSDQVICKTA